MLISSLLILVAAQGWSPLVQIGRIDHGTSDLALGPGGYARYASDPIFIVGRSEPRRDWPYVLPGPSDAWAGSREHPFEIRFGLASVAAESGLRFHANFQETHSSSPPRLRLSVNGSKVAEWDSPNGNGDDAIMGRPETGKPSEWTVDVPAARLKPGENRVELRSLSGSWAVFDAVSIEGRGLTTTEVAPSLELRLTRPGQTLLNTANGPERDLPVRIVNTDAATRGTLIAGQSRQEIELPTGATETRMSIAVPDAAQSIGVRVEASDGMKAEASVAISPVRPWKIFLFPEGHVDIGYTHPQQMVAEIQSQNIRDALGLIDSTRSRPEGERFRWHAETSWAVEHFLNTANVKDRERARAAIANGELGVSAAYANMLYGLCRPEEMLRAFTVSNVPRRSWETATLSDVPGVPWGLVTALHEAGIKNLVYWPNEGDAMRGWIENKPFWWQGRDGKERVFYWPMFPYSIAYGLKGAFHMDGFGYPGRPHAIRTADPSKDFLGEWMPRELDRLAPTYPYRIIGMPWSIVDNGPIDLDIPEAVADWNRRYASPKIEIVTVDEACRRFLKAYGSKLPVLKGDLGPQWEDGAASSAFETGMNRRSSERLAQAEIAWSLTSPSRFPRGRFDQAWKNVLLYSEHTWGASDSTSNPDGENQRRQWAVKGGFAHDADKQSRALLAQAVGLPSNRGFSVLNTSARTRSELVEVDGAGVVKDSAGALVPSQALSDGHTAFIAKDVAALGAKAFRFEASRAKPLVKPGSAIANEFYRVKVDAATGAIASLIRVKDGKELANGAAEPGFAQYSYLLGSDLLKLTSISGVRTEIVDAGPIVWTLRVSGHGDGANGEVVRTIRLVKGVDAVDIGVQFDKAKVREKECAFFSFPFAMQHPTVHIEGPWVPFDPAQELMKGANDQFFTVNRWVQLQSAQGGATVVSLDVPVMIHGRPSAPRLGANQAYDPHSPNLQFQLAQNHWFTNYRADQSGPISARFLIRADSHYDPGASSRFAETYTRPLLVVGPDAAPTLPFAVQGDVELSAIRPAKSGRGWVLRVYGASGKGASMRVVARAGKAISVFASDGREARGRRLIGPIRVPGYGVLTVLVVPVRP